MEHDFTELKKITEDYVSFETAKLLKEKGYKGSFDGYYNDAGCVVDRPNFFLKVPEYQYYERVSLQMVMKWLREVHNIHIKVHCSGNRNYLVYAQSLVTAFNDFCIESTTCSFNSYEQACEEAIKYCLENLI